MGMVLATIKGVEGLVDETTLEKKTYVRQAPSGAKAITEYWKDGELVHRSVEFTPNATVDQLPNQGGVAQP